MQKFRDYFRNSFADFGDRLDDVLIDRAEELSIPKTEEEISADIFRRFENVPLLDPYRAYEKFENHYEEISGDPELIRMEGMATVRKVDPNMVIKKQKGKEAEVQDGWKGHVLPFDLVQRVCLH